MVIDLQALHNLLTTSRTLVKPTFIEHIYMGQNHVELKQTKFAKQ